MLVQFQANGRVETGRLSSFLTYGFSYGRWLRRGLARRKSVLITAVVLHDTLVTCAATYFIFLLLPNVYWDLGARHMPYVLAIIAVLCVPVYLAFKLQYQVWRYFSVRDLPGILCASAVVVFLANVLLSIGSERSGGQFEFLLSVFAHWFFVSFALLAGRLGWQYVIDAAHPLLRDSQRVNRVLLFHAGANCNLWLRGLELNSEAKFEPVGIIDHRSDYVDRTVRQVPILGDLSRLGAVVEELAQINRRPTELILTRHPSQEELALILNAAVKHNLRISAVRTSIATESFVESERIEVDHGILQAVAGRAPIDLDMAPIEKAINGKHVVVTGAGGSIGSELSKLVAEIGCSKLVLIDNCEFNLWKIEQAIKKEFPDAQVQATICDIRDSQRLETVFMQARPDVVLHAAALKHVPMVEANPVEAVLSNVIGTRNVAQATLASGAKAMVQVSTDKAVNPSSVMGATKRVAELHCQALDRNRTATRFMTVRFGNVLGSSGSLIPVFQKQIEEGGPVTVTHPEMTRFFMTIPEACKLVVHSLVLGLNNDDRGNITVLDMGEPVKIIDIAHQMIVLNGKRPGKDIDIKITGIRPGEKLYEVLFDDSEECIDGPTPLILMARSTGKSLEEITQTINELEELIRIGGDDDIVAALQGCVPGYVEHLSFHRDRGAA
ncbi:nucleoside-diphosphate sugar epimerase/dehydratase [Ruegeria arenilitoris]|uniref:nucleoside-diphosphate sugar epimerase/dehydratase n=1 Tax=Ruegeria arenilitoris TaxID=1173585 RepID=UPI00147BACEB